LLSDESMYFHLLLFIVSSCLLKQLLFKIAERSFIMMNLIAFIAFLCFRYFCQSWLICLESKDNLMGFRIFFHIQDKQVYLRNVLSRQADHLQEIARNWNFWWLILF
jgi:hypothetical protein